MKPLYTQQEYNQAKSLDKLKLKCYHCNSSFEIIKKRISYTIKHNDSKCKYCSHKCEVNKRFKGENVFCLQCNKKFYKIRSQINKFPNHFCSRSCAGTYNNKHKKYGIRVSKLEKLLAIILTNYYPDLDIHFNRKDTILSELDIYIPSLSLAFEINGIFHYQPIFGKNKLEKIQSNDTNKYQACLNNEIDLCIINTSQQSQVNYKTSLKYLLIITDIIDNRLNIK